MDSIPSWAAALRSVAAPTPGSQPRAIRVVNRSVTGQDLFQIGLPTARGVLRNTVARKLSAQLPMQPQKLSQAANGDEFHFLWVDERLAQCDVASVDTGDLGAAAAAIQVEEVLICGLGHLIGASDREEADGFGLHRAHLPEALRSDRLIEVPLDLQERV